MSDLCLCQLPEFSPNSRHVFHEPHNPIIPFILCSSKGCSTAIVGILVKPPVKTHVSVRVSLVTHFCFLALSYLYLSDFRL